VGKVPSEGISGPTTPAANVARTVLHPAARSVGVKLDGRPFHTFRHTCASLLFEAGRNVKQVQEWLGHADASFTLRTYVHLMDEGVGDAQFMDEAVRSPAAVEARADSASEKSAVPR
jgi:integrase